MSENSFPAHLLRPFAPAIVLALFSILLGFGLGGVFGATEDSIKAHLKDSAESVLDTVYQGNTREMNAVVSKSWTYLKRAHLHGGAIGTAALSCILLLSLIGKAGKSDKAFALAFGSGAILYSLFWVLAAFKAPGLGSTGAAREALNFIAIPGAGLCLLGLLGTIYGFIRSVIMGSNNVVKKDETGG